MNGIEVYLRQSGERLLLNIYVPKARKEEFLTSLGEGTFEDQAVPMAFEASIQDRWRTGSGEHVRAEIAAINVSWSD